MSQSKPAINKLHSTWITDSILAMQRPSDTLFHNADLISQFLNSKIFAIFNLTEPGEHPYCGHGVLTSGFPYSPEKLMNAGIKHFNYSWVDMTVPSMNMMKDITSVACNEIRAGGKIAVHCHAGYGRTGIVIACILVVLDSLGSKEAVELVRRRRPGSVQTTKQQLFVDEFERHYRDLKCVFTSSDDASRCFVTTKSIAQSVRDQQSVRRITEVAERGQLRWVHKLVLETIDVLCKSLIKCPVSQWCASLCGPGGGGGDGDEQHFESCFLGEIKREINDGKWDLFDTAVRLLHSETTTSTCNTCALDSFVGGRCEDGTGKEEEEEEEASATHLQSRPQSQPPVQGLSFDSSLAAVSQALLDWVESRADVVVGAEVTEGVRVVWAASGALLPQLQSECVLPPPDKLEEISPQESSFVAATAEAPIALYLSLLDKHLDRYQLHLVSEVVRLLLALEDQVQLLEQADPHPSHYPSPSPSALLSVATPAPVDAVTEMDLLHEHKDLVRFRLAVSLSLPVDRGVEGEEGSCVRLREKLIHSRSVSDLVRAAFHKSNSNLTGKVPVPPAAVEAGRAAVGEAGGSVSVEVGSISTSESGRHPPHPHPVRAEGRGGQIFRAWQRLRESLLSSSNHSPDSKRYSCPHPPATFFPSPADYDNVGAKIETRGTPRPHPEDTQSDIGVGVDSCTEGVVEVGVGSPPRSPLLRRLRDPHPASSPTPTPTPCMSPQKPARMWRSWGGGGRTGMEEGVQAASSEALSWSGQLLSSSSDLLRRSVLWGLQGQKHGQEEGRRLSEGEWVDRVFLTSELLRRLVGARWAYSGPAGSRLGMMARPSQGR